jgi:hypothetical protein
MLRMPQATPQQGRATAIPFGAEGAVVLVTDFHGDSAADEGCSGSDTPSCNGHNMLTVR